MISKHQRLNMRKITTDTNSADFYSLFNQFLDDFYHTDNQDKPSLIEDEPITTHLRAKEKYLLAATAKQLAVDFGLPVPVWVEKKGYFPSESIYAFETTNDAFRKYLADTSLAEFKKRKLYLGGNILERV